MVSFSETATTGSSKNIKVYKNYKLKSNHSRYNELNGKTVKTQIGRISYTTGNNFYYYEPPTNTSRPILIDEDLEILKKKVINRRNG
jgi:hypothetical protein